VKVDDDSAILIQTSPQGRTAVMPRPRLTRALVTITAATALTLGLLVTPATAATDTFLKIDKPEIKGEAATQLVGPEREADPTFKVD
jgi:hypothetical protein